VAIYTAKQGEKNKMNQTTLINKISDLGYKGFKEAYLRQIEDVM